MVSNYFNSINHYNFIFRMIGCEILKYLMRLNFVHFDLLMSRFKHFLFNNFFQKSLCLHGFIILI
jgi:hypothetical protein